MTHISGCHDPFETESSRTKNIFSRRMNPSPIFHRRGSLVEYGFCCGSALSNTEQGDFLMANTYSHRVEVGFELPRNQVRKSAAFDWVAALVKTRRGDLISRSMRDDYNRDKYSYLVGLVWRVSGELGTGSVLMQGGSYNDELTRNRHEMALPAFRNTSSSLASRPANLRRSAFPKLIPG